MCGRYYVDNETAREIEKLVRQVDEKRERESVRAADRLCAGDIHPTDLAPVLEGRGGSLCCQWQR